MGCDIHLYVEYSEYKNRPNDYWSFQFPVERRYYLFGLMAGVRGENKLYNTKGIPKDISFITENDYKEWGEDAHSVSWLSVDEYEKCIKTFIKDINKENKGNELNLETSSVLEFVLLNLLKDMVKRFVNVRIVFWFDN